VRPSPRTTRHDACRSDRANGNPPELRAYARAAAPESRTTTSTSSARRPSSSSRTAPPTNHASSPARTSRTSSSIHDRPTCAALARLVRLHRREYRLPRQHRLEPVVFGVLAEGGEAVDRDTAARRVVPRLGNPQRRRAVRRVTREVAMLRRRRFEAPELLARELLVGVRGREMRHEADDVLAQLRQPRRAVATHARVELRVHAYSVGDLLVRDRELELGVARLRDLAARRRRAHHEDADARVFAPQRQSLAHGRDAERARTGSERGTSDVDRAVPVRVRLDDSPELRALEDAHERAHVAPQLP